MLRALLILLLGLYAMPSRAESPNASPQQLLHELYRVHAQGNGPLLDPAATRERRRFFTESLAAALDAALAGPADELGPLDFDPFYNAQETELGALDFAVAKVGGDRTVGIARFENAGDPIEIAYTIVRQPRGWFIDDIDYGEGRTLRKVLVGE